MKAPDAAHGPITCCRVCGSDRLIEVLNLGAMCLTGVFPKTRDEKVPITELVLKSCMECGLVQLRDSCLPDLLYGDNYGYRSGLNSSMVKHLHDKVKRLQEECQLTAGDVVLDVGSNDGTLLNCYPANVISIGFDPSAAKFAQYYNKDVYFYAGMFSADAYRSICDRKAKIITSIAMFYDLEKPLKFMREIVEVLAPSGIWHIEQSYLPTMLESKAFDTICQEHLEYYGLRQIHWMAARCGLRIIESKLNNINGGSFAVTLAHDQFASEVAAVSVTAFNDFRTHIKTLRHSIIELLSSLKAEGKTVLGYGASTKGNVILQYCGITPELLPAIMEVNETKFGCFTPGTGIPIISEAEGHAQKPDYLLVLPWHFAENIIEREQAFLARGGRLIFPLPELRVV